MKGTLTVSVRDDGETKVGFANYQGDVRSMVGQIVGPTEDDFLMKGVEAVYDSMTNTTRVAFVAIN